MISNEKKVLKKVSEIDGDPCVSIVLSTRAKSFADKQKIELKLKNFLSEVGRLMTPNYDEDVIRKTLNSLKKIMNQIDKKHYGKGLGIFFTAGLEEHLIFPFPVENKVEIGQKFNVRGYIDSFDQLPSYTVLLLSKGNTRLFDGWGSNLTEIANKDFPQKMEEEFQLDRASTHSLYNDEESKTDQARLLTYFRKIDSLFSRYIKASPVFLLGVTKHLSEFKSVTKNEGKIAGELRGNFDKHSIHELQEKLESLVNTLTVEI